MVITIEQRTARSIEELRKELAEYKISTDIRLNALKTQNEANQFRTFKDVKAEFKAFVTVSGYSKLLGTRSLFTKLLWLICVIPLFAYCLFLVHTSLEEFLQYHVVTQVLVKDEDTMVFPAITFCIREISPKNIFQLVAVDFAGAFQNCTFTNETFHICTLDNFEKTPIYDHQYGIHHDCYKFNGGLNPISTSIFGVQSGLIIQFNISAYEFVSYYVGKNTIEPKISDMSTINQPHEIVLAGIKKTVDIKLPVPYNNCTECRTVSYDINEYVFNPYQIITNLTIMNFFLSESRYTEISQLVKTSKADLISNAGGVLGLFLEVSFLSFHRLLIFLFDVVF